MLFPLGHLARADVMGVSVAGKETVFLGNLEQGRQFGFLVAKKNENTPEYFERFVLDQILVAHFKESGVGIIPVKHFAYGFTGGILHFKKQSPLFSGAGIDGFLVAFEPKPPLPPAEPFFGRMTMVKSRRNDHIAWVADHVETSEWHGQRRQIKLAMVLENNGAGRGSIALFTSEEQCASVFANLPENISHPYRARLMVRAHQLEGSLLWISDRGGIGGRFIFPAGRHNFSDYPSELAFQVVRHGPVIFKSWRR